MFAFNMLHNMKLELSRICDQMHECIHRERYIKTVYIKKDQRMKLKNSRNSRDACTDAANTICKVTSYNG